MSIVRLSNGREESMDQDGLVLAMVGSFAPVHEGHFDAILSAKRAIESLGEHVSALIMSPNSDDYVLKKINDQVGEWNFEHRIQRFIDLKKDLPTPFFVDDISGKEKLECTITESVIKNIKNKLGIVACNVVLTVGSDQIKSMRPYLKNNRAVCVLRPDNYRIIEDVRHEEWFEEMTSRDQLIITDRENTQEDISSTNIRKKLGSVSIGGYINDRE